MRTQRLTGFAMAHRRLVLGGWLVLAIAGGWAASSIGDALSRTLDAPGRPAFEANARIARQFGTGGQVSPIVLVVRAPAGTRVTAPAALAALARAVARVSAAVGRARTVSYASTRDAALVSEDRRTTYALVFPPLGRPAPDENPQALAAATRAARDLRVAGAPVQVTGVEALAEDTGGGGAGLLVETLAGGLGALVVLALVFASALALVPLLVAAVAILTTFLALRGLAAVTDVSFVVQFLVALIGLGVAIDYSLLVVVRWREERARGAGNDEAVRTAMATAGHSVAVSGVTVAIGLLALVAVPVPFIRSIGFGGMLIPLLSVAAALTLLPAILAGVGPRIDRRRAARPRPRSGPAVDGVGAGRRPPPLARGRRRARDPLRARRRGDRPAARAPVARRALGGRPGRARARHARARGPRRRGAHAGRGRLGRSAVGAGA